MSKVTIRGYDGSLILSTLPDGNMSVMVTKDGNGFSQLLDALPILNRLLSKSVTVKARAAIKHASELIAKGSE